MTTQTAKTNTNRTRTNIRKLAVIAMLSALAAVIQLLEIPVPMLIPEFVKLDFSELPALIASFVVSPWAGIPVCLVKNLIKLTTTSSAGVGELANFLIGIFMVVPAGLIYRHKKTKRSALMACLAGCLISAAISVFVNYFISYPVFYRFMAPEEAVLNAYRAILPSTENIFQALLIFNMPFTFVKMLLDSIITFAVYKPLSNALKRVW
ncbi:MAG: ECF transporter S component [Firmicutes bacterium]|nr:ECF transporter S component [[Eubacterium] siraeum]MCM1487149.1 ECF transporter S component [Bacillota bacterium]